MNVESGFQMADLKGVLRRRAKLVFATWLVVSLASYWLAMALPNEYESSATVLVEPQSVDEELIRAGVARSDLNRRLGLMAAKIMSRPRLSRIIDDLSLYREESNYLERQEIINLMRDQVKVEPVIPELEQDRQTLRTNFEINRFKIHFRDHNAEVARNVAQRLANDFIEEHISNRVEVSQKSLEFIDAELVRLAESIRAIESRVAEIKAANPGRLPEDMAANQRQLERLMTAVSYARRDASTARSDEAFFHSQSATARELLGGNTLDRRYGGETRVDRKQSLNLLLTDMRSRGYTEKHPDIVKTQAELATLEDQIEASKSDERPGSLAEHGAEAEAERARLRRLHAESEIELLRSKEEELLRLLGEAPGVAEQLDGLDRQYQHLFQSYQDFSNRRHQASVQADLERRQLGEQFRVLEQAFIATEASSPNRVVIILVGVLFGLAMGGAAGIVMEAADPTVHDARQLQASLNIPVLATIPEIWLESDRLRKRRSTFRQSFATAALVVLALVGGAANYVWVNGTSGDEQEESISRNTGARAPDSPTGELVGTP
ncbi:MAG: hypothetical protein IIA30_17045 [Myxococcales bacterium]|nr:hypothetical protein [Myxococcales bacterium]